MMVRQPSSGSVTSRCRMMSCQAPATIVYVTVRVSDATTPAADVAESVYVRDKPDAFRVDIPVTAFCAVALRLTEPALVPPDGAASTTASVTPDGIAASISATILRLDSLVVIEYVKPLDTTLVGAEPAFAALMVSEAVGAEREISLIAWTSKVTSCVASWASACAEVKLSATAAIAAM